MFATLTNVNFDDARFVKYITQGLAIRNERAAAYKAKTGKEYVASGAAAFNPTAPCDLTAVSLETFGKTVGVKARQAALGEEVVGLQELITYGLKGTCGACVRAR
jgi:hydroxylamine reductase